MTVPTILIIIGAIFAAVDQFQAQGRSLLAWAVLFVCAALLWGNLS